MNKLASATKSQDSEVYANLTLLKNHEYQIEYEFKFDAEKEFENGSYLIISDTILLYPKLRKENNNPTYANLWHLNKIELDDKTYTTKRILK